MWPELAQTVREGLGRGERIVKLISHHMKDGPKVFSGSNWPPAAYTFGTDGMIELTSRLRPLFCRLHILKCIFTRTPKHGNIEHICFSLHARRIYVLNCAIFSKDVIRRRNEVIDLRRKSSKA